MDLAENQDFLTASLTNNNLSELSGKIKRLLKLRENIKEMEEKLKQVKKEENQLSGEEIPAYLAQFGIDSIKLDNGKSVTIREDLKCSLPKTDYVKRKNYLNWLRENGGSDIIKEELTINSPNAKIIEHLRKENITFLQSENIHPSTLKAFFRDILGITKNSVAKMEKSELPDYINLYIHRETKIK